MPGNGETKVERVALHHACCHNLSLVTVKHHHMEKDTFDTHSSTQLRLMLGKTSELFIKALLASIGFLGIYMTNIAMIAEHLDSML